MTVHRAVLAFAALALIPHGLLAQEQSASQPPDPPAEDGKVIIDIKDRSPDPRDGFDEIAEERCRALEEAARIRGEIIVCRSLGEASDGSWDPKEFERRYAEATQGVKPVDVDGSGLPFGLAPLVTINGCFIPPCPKDSALIIDVEALPDAPMGSDADRIARGLPALGPEGDEGRVSSDPISEDELGLPPIPNWSEDAG